ncbi:MAG: Lrp/AsnC family transcriptional regulator [Candidatus Anstonellales archaeon]
MVEEVDEKSLYILRLLSKDSRLSCREIASLLRMHPATVIKKIKEMEREKVIKKYTINVDYEKLGYTITAFVFVQYEFGRYALEELGKISGVIGVYEITGEYDAICLVVAKNRSNFKEIIHAIATSPGVKKTNTATVLTIVKEPAGIF